MGNHAKDGDSLKANIRGNPEHQSFFISDST